MSMTVAETDGAWLLVLTVVGFPIAAGLPLWCSVWSLCRLAAREEVRGPGGERVIVYLVLPLITLGAGPVASVALAQMSKRGRISDAAGPFALLLLVGITYGAWLHPLWQHWSGKEIDPFEQTGDLGQRISAAEKRLSKISSLGVSQLLWDHIDTWTTNHCGRAQDLKPLRLAWSGARHYFRALKWRSIISWLSVSVVLTTVSWVTADFVAAPRWFFVVNVASNLVVLTALASIDPLGNAYYVLRLKKRYLELVAQRGKQSASVDDVAQILNELAQVRAVLDTLRERPGQRVPIRGARSRWQRQSL